MRWTFWVYAIIASMCLCVMVWKFGMLGSVVVYVAFVCGLIVGDAGNTIETNDNRQDQKDQS